MTSVKVAVRVRPLNHREDGLSSQVIIQMEGNKTRITNPKVTEASAEGDHAREMLKSREFTFDHSFWSLDEKDDHYASQEQVFTSLGEDVVSSAFDGYNVCIFAYGQTGSGKTYTMMGSEDDQGLIPRFCNALFSRLQDNSTSSYQIHVSYLEIYNEKVRDLLKTSQSDSGKTVHNLRVREHPRDGPYVQDLSKHSVISYDAIASLMKKGNASRTTAATNMNDAKFMDGVPSERHSKINLVDLAGSERADSSGATGQRLKEGGSINKSLVSLGNVISLLAEKSENGNKGKQAFIPYRDSVLTWLLKDSLGGNAKTIMVATISPADVNYGETLSTLRYANRAKNIINRPTVNEDPNVKLIRELREEIARLKSLLEGNVDSSPRVQERLHENEARIKVLTEEWAEKWNESASLMKEKSLALRHKGVGVVLDSALPHLIGISDDILSTGIMLYHLKEGITKVGSDESDEQQDITISGPGVESEHCVIEHKDGTVVLHPIEGALCTVNTHAITEPTKLQQGMLITLGQTNMFRFNHPDEAKQMKMNMQVRKSASTLSLPQDDGTVKPRLTLLSQSMSDLYRSNESLALNGSTWDVSSTTYREDQEELEHKRQEIMALEDKYTEREGLRREAERQIEDELNEKNEKLRQLEDEIENIKSKNNPYDNIVDGLRNLDQQEEDLLEDLRISKENLLKEIENLSWYPDQVEEEDAIAQVISDLGRQIKEKDEQITRVKQTADRQKVKVMEKRKDLQDKVNKEEREIVNLKDQYDTEKKRVLATNDNVLHEVQDLALREDDLLSQHELADEQKKGQWKKVLDQLNDHTARIEEAWHDLEDNEARVKAISQKGNFSSAQEKLECEMEAQQLAEARKLLEEEEHSFAQHQQEEMARVEAEMEVWETQKMSEVGALRLSRQELLWQHSNQLRELDGQIELKRDKLGEVKESLKQVDKELEGVSEEFDPQVKALEEERSVVLKEQEEMERKIEEKSQQRKDKIEELEVEIESLEHSYKLKLDEIREERMRLVGLQEEVLRKLTVDDGSQETEANLMAAEELKAQREELEARQRELERQQQQLRVTASELEAEQRRLDQERETQLDKIEYEKLKLLDMERQDRVNSLVEQEVKCRLFEQKLERERLRKMERERDKQERDKEIQRLKSIHQREMEQLKAKLEMSSQNSSKRVLRTQSCETMTMSPQRKYVIRQLTFSEPPAQLNVEIPTFVLRGSGRDVHYEYLVQVTIGPESWCVFRRYSRFREMHNMLKKKYPVVNQLVFPPRRFFHRNKKVAAERRTLLEEYVRHVIELCMRIPDCPLNPKHNRHITKQVLIEFEPFFRRGLFEASRNVTS